MPRALQLVLTRLHVAPDFKALQNVLHLWQTKETEDAVPADQSFEVTRARPAPLPHCCALWQKGGVGNQFPSVGQSSCAPQKGVARAAWARPFELHAALCALCLKMRGVTPGLQVGLCVARASCVPTGLLLAPCA